MTITEHTTVADIATAIPSSVRVFQRHGVDFCCGGKRPLALVCEEQGLSLADLTSEIEASSLSPEGDRDWTKAPLADLADHIVTTYHDALRAELPRLETMAAKVARVHGAHAAYLAQVEDIVGELSADLNQHMRKEELIVFPAIRGLEAAVPGRVSFPFEAPITVMEQEHDHAGELFAELRRMTGQYVAPEWACATFRALYQGLADLEAAMHVHVHLENNVLFPRALALAGIGVH